MKNKITQISVTHNEEVSSILILQYIAEKRIIYIKNKNNNMDEILHQINISGPAIILNSSGSSKASKKCIHHISNLNQSAHNSGLWLEEQGIELKNCIIFNTLPLNHISGLMPLWRSKIWNCEYINISQKLIKETEHLLERTISNKKITEKYLITSLVPTQLKKLISYETGIKWLKLFDLIWIGGASISKKIAQKCREEKINLSPCYGATETAAMISILKPEDFLKGYDNVGEPLKDIDCRINKNNVIEIKSKRLGIQLNLRVTIRKYMRK